MCLHQEQEHIIPLMIHNAKYKVLYISTMNLKDVMFKFYDFHDEYFIVKVLMYITFSFQNSAVFSTLPLKLHAIMLQIHSEGMSSLKVI